MSDTRAVVEVKWLLAAFPEAELRNDIVWLNGSAFPVTTLEARYVNRLDDEQSWWASEWADDIQDT